MLSYDKRDNIKNGFSKSVYVGLNALNWLLRWNSAAGICGWYV